MEKSFARSEAEPGKYIKFFNYNPSQTGIWFAGEVAGLEQRDLGLLAASLGDMDGRCIRASEGLRDSVDWSSSGLDLRFLYVLSGSIQLDTESGTIDLEVNDALSLVGRQKARILHASSGFEALELMLRSSSSDPLGGESTVHVARLTTESFETGNNLRRFFAYRDLGLSKLTSGRVHIQAIKTIDTPQGGTGWHYHSMSQFAFGLTGAAIVDFDGQASITIGPRDGVSIPRHCKHNLSSLTNDYSLIEVCLPGQYATVAVEPPQLLDAV